MRTIVVAGHGMVAQRLLEQLVERGADWRIVVFGAEEHAAYDRIRLSASFRAGPLAPPEFFATHGIELHLGEAVVRVDPEGRTVETARGRVQPFDALVLATGARAVVPRIPGHRSRGCFPYRTLDDARAIEAYAQGVPAGVVIGGGPLGLEAATALRALDLATTVVELAPRLLPRQLDEDGSAVLRGHVTGLDITVHCGASVRAVLGDPVRGVVVDRSTVDAGLVVFAVGVRPEDTVAREAGLAVHPDGGVVVDHACRTSVPEVYAIGDCARVDGRAYGLVGPGYAMADVVAARLTGVDDAVLSRLDTSTTVTLLGVDVATFGEPHAGRRAYYADSGVYRAVRVDPKGRLAGGVLVGDVSGYGALRASVGTPAPDDLGSLVLPATEDTRDDSLACFCLNLTAARVRQGDTRAGSVCGGCAPLVRQLLAEQQPQS